MFPKKCLYHSKSTIAKQVRWEELKISLFLQKLMTFRWFAATRWIYSALPRSSRHFRGALPCSAEANTLTLAITRRDLARKQRLHDEVWLKSNGYKCHSSSFLISYLFRHLGTKARTKLLFVNQGDKECAPSMMRCDDITSSSKLDSHRNKAKDRLKRYQERGASIWMVCGRSHHTSSSTDIP